jgi:hypothetical protein
MVTPGTPEYEEGQAIHAAGQRNLDFYLKHEAELFERFPGPCVLLIYNGDQVRGFESFDEMMTLLDTLDNVERAAALELPVPEPGTALIL